MTEEVKNTIRNICTHHGDEGTSGYDLSEEQFSALFTLVDVHTNNILDNILLKGHGGGNWRRLIELAWNK